MAVQRATAVAHPNVALVKYWGKQGADAANLPAVGSLSITLGALRTETQVEFDSRLSADQLLLNGAEPAGEQPRLQACLDALRALAGTHLHARVESVNDFPTGAGLASSASGYAALVTAGAAALGIDPAEPRLADIARIGSGSAPRSLYGGFVALHLRDGHTVCEPVLAAGDWPLRVVVAVTTEAGKAITSRNGMQLSRDTSPYYPAWLATHPDDLARGLRVVAGRDFDALAELSEHNCLKMHAVMMTSQPPLLYWSPTTLACMHAIHDLRHAGVPVFFTIDAGPQVKAVCMPEAESRVAAALADVPGVLRVIPGGLGGAPTLK